MFEGVDDFYVEFLRTVENSDYGKLVTQALLGFVPEKYLSDFSFYTDDDRKFRYVRDAVLGPSHYDQIMGYMLNDHGIDVNEFSADLWIREDHLRCLHKEGHIIGLHSHTHPMVLAELSQQEQQSEYENNFKILHKILDLAPTTMSHPNNSYNEITLSTLRELGICLGFRSNAAEPVLSELEFPRDDHATIIREMGN
jgi:peptidoglycan/xylan/chitin deacetylase (PgdA/CDA1 family)